MIASSTNILFFFPPAVAIQPIGLFPVTMALLIGKRLINLSLLLLLLSSSCAWANDGTRDDGSVVLGRRGSGEAEEAAEEIPLWRRVGVEIRDVVDHVEKLAERQRHPRRSPLPTKAAEHADKVVREACLALITPAPVLVQRQDDGQIQALSQQLQQLSQSS